MYTAPAGHPMILLLATFAHAEDLYVSSNVKGASILLNGVDTGFRTPATLHGVAPGAVEVAVELGCARGQSTVTVAAGMVTRVSVAATQQLGTLTLAPDPVQAKLFLDEAPFPGRVGSPVAVECGSHTVRAELYGYVPAVLAVDVEVNQDLTIPITLSPLGYSVLDLSVRPRDATLIVDNVPVGADAVTLPSVFAGGHTLSAELDGYQTVKTQVVVAEGESQAWHFELVRSGQKKKQSTAVQLRGGGGTTTVDRVPAAAAVESSAPEEVVATKAASPTNVQKATPQATTSEKTISEKQTSEKTADAAKTSSKQVAEQPAVAASAKAQKKPGATDYYSRSRAEHGAEPTSAGPYAGEVVTAPVEEDLDEAQPPATTTSAKSSKAAEKAAEKAAAEREAAEKAAAEAEAAAEKRADADRADAAKRARRDEDTPDDGTPEEDEEKDSKPGKVGRTIAGTGLLALGAGAGGVGVYYYDRTQVAYDAYNAKLTAAKAQDNPALRQEANNFYDKTLVPRRNIMYASGGASLLCLASGITLVLVDDRLPVLAPLPGGAMMRWHLSF